MKIDKKIPLKTYIMLACGLILLVGSIFLAYKIITNHQFVLAYENDIYLVEKEDRLAILNTPEGYLPYYNLGNVAYKQQDYNSAIGYYTRALHLFPIGQKECDIRINLALSMCYSIDYFDLDSQEKVDTALIILYKARDILLENNWATADGEGHRNDDAQQLKEDIERLIKQLENNQDSGDDSGDDQNNSQNNQDQGGSSDQSQGQSEREKRQKEQLERKKKDAMEERKQEQDDLDKWFSYGEDGEGEEDGLDGEGGGNYKPW